MTPARLHGGNAGFTLIDLVVTLSLIAILAGVALPEFDQRRLQIVTAQRLVLATLRTARADAITKSQHFAVSFAAANQLQLAPMVQNPPGSGTWQMDTANMQTIQLPSATQVAATVLGVTVEFTARGTARNLTGPLQIDAQDTYGVTKSLQVWPSGQVNEL